MSDINWKRQGTTIGGLALALLLALSLTACGKKPNHVDPPLGVEDDPFPAQTYPNPKTDPAPTLDPRPDLAPPAPVQPERF